MKMTGHLLYGIYTQTNGTWVAREPGPLQDPFNRHVRLVFSLSNKHHLALSDARRFAKVTLVETFPAATHNDLQILGPDPTDKKFSLANFRSALLKKPRGKIKTVLMDQTILAGIGNIYSDEALWLSGLHPEKIVGTLSLQDTKSLFKSLRTVLKLGIDFGGDSTSDYRRPDGSPGTFQHRHNVYQRRGERCKKRGCNGVITRIVVNGRSAHFCSQHQRK